MLEVVEHEKRTGTLEGVRRASRQAFAWATPAPDDACDRRLHESGIGDGGETDEVHGTLDRRCSRRLEREPALARSTRAR